ncbi:MAG: PorT family protein [Chitinispirillales bacterium]|jgi:hypothetical protein|nr:PorT family protein [Chitinispirillales bacterium]
MNYIIKINKKLWLLFAFLQFTIFTETTALSPNVFGVKGGLSFSYLWGDGIDALGDRDRVEVFGIDKINNGSLLFVNGGVFLRFDVIPNFLSIQPELLYIRQGQNWKLHDVNGKTSVSVYTDYLTLPVAAKLIIPFESVPLSSSVYAGPALSLKLQSRAKNIASIPEIHRHSMQNWGKNIGSRVNPLDLGLIAGFNVDIASVPGPGEIVVDLRFQWGFIEVFNINEDFRNYSFQIMAGYQINL